MATIMMNDKRTESRCLSVEEKLNLTRPETLFEGESYVYRDGHLCDKPAMSIVQFIAYTSCPAIVVVSDGSGLRVRCPRDGLFRRLSATDAGINGMSDEPC